ncbi:serine/threonine-protein kinase nekl-2 [Eurosta solidaginis]|uniref:serine/threonine-protein kinase nekl-2 n=1 Tax=Eurosta solidaginis TaxID=178769 RepID=UPI0035313129
MNLGDSSLQLIRVLGEGGFGRAYLCKTNDPSNQHYVCVKSIRIRQPNAEMKMLMQEIYIISQLKHPNIVRFIRSFVYLNSLNIVMEFAANGTIRDVISTHNNHRPCIPRKIFISLMYGILLGLEYLHIRHVIHRDLKPENILLDSANRIKIADFGISTIHTTDKPLHGLIGTYLYMAPEVMRGEKYEFKSDIWSLGCILYEMCIGTNPFSHAQNLPHLKYMIQRSVQYGHNIGPISTYYGVEWGRLCEKMLNVQPKKRISISSIIKDNPKIAISYYVMYFKYSYYKY